MSLNFQQVQIQVRQLGEKAPWREQRLKILRDQARDLLKSNAHDLSQLRQKVQLAAHSDPTLRCALPMVEHLETHAPAPSLPELATILAADGSQIAPNRHAEVEYCLINVGTIQVCHGAADPPRVTVNSQLFYDEELYTSGGMMSEASLALLRDLNERKALVELAKGAIKPVITFTDGPMELWGAKDGDAGDYQQKLEAYKDVLAQLCAQGVATAGYVDKPSANLVVRLLEVAMLPEEKLKEIRNQHPLRGVTDRDLFWDMLEPGERSAVFAMQSKSAANYPDELALRFFYLNVGRQGHSWLARVEVPDWVAGSEDLLSNLHAALVAQCRIMGNRPYPYLLHRAHEAAVVTLEEQEQVTQMIALELRKRGVSIGEESYKQAAKGLSGRTRYEG
ncbi:MAG: DNA double-strand break repair nuclease NurA [Chloroflexota bacterium]|nr:MAG: DNA double-strand break repair nuclease NurA [Chloroflexota bacterium]